MTPVDSEHSVWDFQHVIAGEHQTFKLQKDFVNSPVALREILKKQVTTSNTSTSPKGLSPILWDSESDST